jgi:hypothetical protein
VWRLRRLPCLVGKILNPCKVYKIGSVDRDLGSLEWSTIPASRATVTPIPRNTWIV